MRFPVRLSPRVVRLAAVLALVAAQAPAPVAAAGPGAAGLFLARLAGSHVSPPVASAGTGSIQVQVAGTAVFYQGSVSGVTPTEVDLRLGAIGRNGALLFTLQASGTFISGQLGPSDLVPGAGVTYDQALDAIGAGGTYLTVRTDAYPGGELRGQLDRRTDPPVVAIGVGSPPGSIRDFPDIFPRSVTVPMGVRLEFSVGAGHTATILPLGMTADQDAVPDPTTSPAGCGAELMPCTFDGTQIVSIGPGAGSAAAPFVVTVAAMPGTYVIHSRLEPQVVGSITVVPAGTEDVSSIDDRTLAIDAQVAAEPGQGPATSIFSGLLGHDVSYPDCGAALPQASGVRIVGVNGGRMFRPNPCLADLHAWARSGGIAGLYVNTNAPLGPYASRGLTGPAGTCSAKDLRCTSYNFGYNAAKYAWSYAKNTLGLANLPRIWWLDVETTNSWFSNRAYNVQVIQGAMDFLGRPGRYGAPSKGYTVGIYSTRYQWGVIAGAGVRPNVPVWYATVERTADAALARCGPASGNPWSFTGGPVWLVQYLPGVFDADVGCP